VKLNDMRTITSVGVVATYVSIAVLMIWMAPPAAAAPAARDGGTTVTVDGSTVTISVHIDLCCVQGASERDVWTPLVQADVKAAQDMWNQALGQLPAKECYDLHVVFDAHLLNKGDAWEPGYHEITMDFGQRGKSLSYDFWASSQTSDDDTVYISTVTGTFFVGAMNPLVYAHEIGHLMGLGDDYTEDGCLVGRIGTLMCSQPGTIDQQLADRLADILNEDGSLPQCWKGTLKGRNQGGGYDYSAILPFSFVVDPNGGIKGKGHFKVTNYSSNIAYYPPAGRNPGYECTSLRKWIPDEFDVPIGGRRDGNQFDLRVGYNTLKTTLDVQTLSCTNGAPPGDHGLVKGSPVIYLDRYFYLPQVLAEDKATNNWHVTLPANYTNKVDLTGSIEVHRADGPTPRNMKNDNSEKLQYLY
jgi:hypothetical protein